MGLKEEMSYGLLPIISQLSLYFAQSDLSQIIYTILSLSQKKIQQKNLVPSGLCKK